jgi:hypothetical protein
MLAAAIVLISLGGALPLIGLVLIAVDAKRSPDVGYTSDQARAIFDEGHRTGLFDLEPMERVVVAVLASGEAESRRVRRDLLLIGGGALCAATGGMISLGV